MFLVGNECDEPLFSDQTGLPFSGCPLLTSLEDIKLGLPAFSSNPSQPLFFSALLAFGTIINGYVAWTFNGNSFIRSSHQASKS